MKRYIFFYNCLVGLCFALIEIAYVFWSGIKREQNVWFQTKFSSLKFMLLSLLIYSIAIFIIAYISSLLAKIINKYWLKQVSAVRLNVALTGSIFSALFLGTHINISRMLLSKFTYLQLLLYGLPLFFASIFIFAFIGYFIFGFSSNLLRDKNKSILLISFFSILIFINLIFCFIPQQEKVSSEQMKEKPNIILISIDTLRQDRLGCYGYDKPTSPNIDMIAHQGAIFINSFAQYHSTLPSHISMMTSLPPLVHDVVNDKDVLDRNRKTLAEILKSHGYACIAFVDGKKFSRIGGAHGFSRGFDWYGHYPENTTIFSRLLPIRLILGIKRLLIKYYPEHGEGITNNVMAWLSKNQKYPFFLFIHYFSVHSQLFGLPYWRYPPFDEKLVDLPVIPERFVIDGISGGRFLNKILQSPRLENFVNEDLPVLNQLYDCGVAYVDSQIGRLYKQLKNLNLLDSTALFITSDHGEEFMEHGKLLHSQDYVECLKVPLIISLPHFKSQSNKIYSNVQGTDLAPTILDLAGIKPLPEMTGNSLMVEIRRQSLPERAIISTCGKAMHYKNYSLLLKDKKIEVYDLIDDPKQKNDLSKQRPDVVEELMNIYIESIKKYNTFKSNLKWQNKKEVIILSPKEIQELKSLGYIK